MTQRSIRFAALRLAHAALAFAAVGADTFPRISLDERLNAPLRLPRLDKDFVLYIAQSPANPKELAIATRRRNVFVSPDAGGSWKKIAREGSSP
jgi:hypothetical protein